MARDDAPRPSPAGRPPLGATPDPRRPRDLRPADRARMQRRRWLRELRRAPAFLIVAAALHLLLGWLLSTYWPRSEPGAERLERSVRASLDRPQDAAPPLPLPPPPEVEPPPEVVMPDPTVAEPAPEQVQDPARAVLGLGAGGTARGGGARRGGAGAGAALDPLSIVAPGDPFAEFVGDLRKRGLDVVFVVDATGSMQRFIDRARAVIDDIADDLSAVVPDLRLGLVAYRDLADDWVTRVSPLDADRYRLANFLIDLRAAGGRRLSADLPEAVEVGLQVAVEELAWREGARRVILLVGDAPYHEEDRAAALSAVRDFVRAPQSVVNALLVRADDREPTSNEEATREAFGRLVQAGGGAFFELLTESDASTRELRRQVLEATFGRRWMQEIDALLAQRGPDRRAETVARHLRQEDRAWFLRHLRDPQVHPLVVRGAAALLDRKLGEGVLAMLAEPGLARRHRQAALHVLKRALPVARGVDPPLDAPLPADHPDLQRLRTYVATLPVTPEGGTARPPALPPALPPR